MLLYRLPSEICKLIAVFMVWAIVSQPILVIAAEDQTQLENEKVTTYQVEKTSVVKAEEDGVSANSRQLTDKEKEWQFGNSLLNYYIKDGQRKGPEWLKSSEFAINFSQHNSPVYSFETIQPLGKVTANGQQWFWQGRYARESVSNSTGNIGFGWRKLAKDKSSLFGLNVFYDYGFQYNLKRLGVGAEYFNKLAECRANWYYPLSNDRLTGISYQTNGMLYSYIRVVEGLDFEAGTSFTHAPWLKIFAGGYLWDNKHHEDEAGYRLRGTLQLTPQINMEVGYTHSNVSHSLYGNMKYQLAFGGGKKSKKETKEKPASVDSSDKLLQKVNRDNDIKTETYTKFVWYKGSIKATVTNSVTNTPLYGATVQAYQNGEAVGSAVTTDTSGNAVLSGLNAGNYTVHVTYAGGMYKGDSSSVTVTKDAVVNAAVGLAVSGGSAAITVINNSGTALSGATVTAIYKSNSTTVASLGTKILHSILGVQTAYAAATTFSISKTTDANGVAAFMNLPPGTYTFNVTYNGQSMISEEIAVTSGGTITDEVIVPTSGGNIHVAVKDTSGAAVSGASVTAASGSTAVAAATTDTNGVAILSGIADGSYTVTASHANYCANSSVAVEVSEGYTSKSTFTLTRNTGSADISVTFSDGATGVTPSFYVDGSTTAASMVVKTAPTSIAPGVYTLSGLSTNALHSITVAADHYTSTGAVSVTPTTTGVATGSITLTKEIVYVTVTAGTHGTTTYGTTTIAAGTTVNIPVNYGSSLTLNFAPDTYYKASAVTVGGINKGPQTSYTLSNITSPVAVSSAYAEITYQLALAAATIEIQVDILDVTDPSSSRNNEAYTIGTTCKATLYASHLYTIKVKSEGVVVHNVLEGSRPSADLNHGYW